MVMRFHKSFDLAVLILSGVMLHYGCDAGSASGPGNDDDTTSTGGSGPGSGGNTSGPGSGGSTTSSGGGVTIPPDGLIDDLEDGNGGINPVDGRVGYWYVYNDETPGAMQSPEPMTPFLPVAGGAVSTLNAANTTGTGFTTWGAGMGFDLNNMGDKTGGPGMKEIYDASKWQGIAFHAKGNIPSIRVKVIIQAVIPEAENGTCTAMCSDAHGKIIALSPDWQQFSATWAELLQEGWGTTASFDAGTLMQIQFQVGANQTFDFSVDDVGFF
jgi:hypothetical protein